MHGLVEILPTQQVILSAHLTITALQLQMLLVVQQLLRNLLLLIVYLVLPLVGQ